MVKKGSIPWNKGKKELQTAWNKGMKMSKEFCRKNSEAHKGEKNHMYGRHHTEETKQKLSKALMGRKFTIEHCRNISEKCNNKGENNPMYGRRGKDSPLYGRTHSKETKKKMSISALKIWEDSDRRKMYSERFKGENNPSWNPNREEVYAPYGSNYYNERVRIKKRILQKDRDLLTGDKINFNMKQMCAFHHIDYNKSNDNMDNLCWLSKLNHNRITNCRKNKLLSTYFKNILHYNLQLLKQGKIPIIWSNKNINLFIKEDIEQLKLKRFI